MYSKSVSYNTICTFWPGLTFSTVDRFWGRSMKWTCVPRFFKGRIIQVFAAVFITNAVLCCVMKAPRALLKNNPPGVPQATSLWGKVERNLQCINLRCFLKHACRACNYTHVWLDEIWKTNSIFFLIEDDPNSFQMQVDLKFVIGNPISWFFGMQHCFNPTRWNMKDDLNFLLNWRRPQFFYNVRLVQIQGVQQNSVHFVFCWFRSFLKSYSKKFGIFFYAPFI